MRHQFHSRKLNQNVVFSYLDEESLLNLLCGTAQLPEMQTEPLTFNKLDFSVKNECFIYNECKGKINIINMMSSRLNQLKSVMEQVLDFAVRELTKIVEASYDDLLLEITKMEREQQILEERLGRGGGGGEKARGGSGGRRRGSENDSASPSGSDDTHEELAEVTVSKEGAETEDPDRPPVLSVSQDWVPILDKVFGQKWCSDVWKIKEVAGGGGRSLGEAGGGQVAPLSTPAVTLEPSPSSPQQDPRWTPLEDMEVFSPDDDAADWSSGRRSSASMLHRLLTLPSQLLDDEDEDAPTAKETMAEEEEEEEEEEEGKGRKKKRRRVWSECEECGRRFSRMSLLKAHRQTHVAESAADTTSPSSPAGTASSLLRCSECGKRFYSAMRLHSHIRTEHAGNRS
uniref:C2H2-type domain-containing protein n=1 Tax=Echeneis naucrates TaxID=173247 RepID=A0A665XC19_ECHNA